MAKKRHQIITYNRFIRTLNKLYNGNNSHDYLVKWYMQDATFSYDIFHRDEAFLGTPVFISEVFWHGNDSTFRKILNDINMNLTKFI